MPTLRLRTLGLLGISMVFGAYASSCVTGTDFVVTSTADGVDANPGDGDCATATGLCTLRAAVQEANALPGGNIIRLTGATTYTLSLPEPSNGGIAGGDLDITDTLQIRPVGAGKPDIRVDGEFRVFEVHSGFTRLDSLVIRDGSDMEGGGINVQAPALVWGFFLDIRDNAGFSRAGGVMNYGGLVLSRTQIRDNRADARGGGVRTAEGSTTTLWYSSVTGNVASIGGGILTHGTVSVFNSTISGNSAENGHGGVFNAGLLRLANATVVQNTSGLATRTGGVGNDRDGTAIVRNSILALNSNPFPGASQDCQGTITSEGYNLIQDTTQCTVNGTTTGNVTGQDPLLQALATVANGTMAHRPESGSPAIDAGNPATPGNPPACWSDDQRLVSRTTCDIGAYER